MGRGKRTARTRCARTERVYPVLGQPTGPVVCHRFQGSYSAHLYSASGRGSVQLAVQYGLSPLLYQSRLLGPACRRAATLRSTEFLGIEG
ncbi:hypothetical protein MTO96_011132 [Rhipicephalus appendiculatus]